MSSVYEQMKKKNPKKLFPVGSRVYIDYISDNSYPTAIGKCGIVRLVDDAGQVHLKMEDGKSATVCLTYGDRFFRLTEK